MPRLIWSFPGLHVALVAEEAGNTPPRVKASIYRPEGLGSQDSKGIGRDLPHLLRPMTTNASTPCPSSTGGSEEGRGQGVLEKDRPSDMPSVLLSYHNGL